MNLRDVRVASSIDSRQKFERFDETTETFLFRWACHRSTRPGNSSEKTPGEEDFHEFEVDIFLKHGSWTTDWLLDRELQREKFSNIN